MTYDEFRDAVSTVLKTANRPMTWTEVRTVKSLPQKWPNNQWVRRLEQDIGLLRKKDAHGIIHWEANPP